jgi:hypothetical protein
MEVTGAIGGSLQLSQGQLQFLVGGNYQVIRKMSFDFGIVGGKFKSLAPVCNWESRSISEA